MGCALANYTSTVLDCDCKLAILASFLSLWLCNKSSLPHAVTPTTSSTCRCCCSNKPWQTTLTQIPSAYRWSRGYGLSLQLNWNNVEPFRCNPDGTVGPRACLYPSLADATSAAVTNKVFLLYRIQTSGATTGLVTNHAKKSLKTFGGVVSPLLPS